MNFLLNVLFLLFLLYDTVFNCCAGAIAQGSDEWKEPIAPSKFFGANPSNKVHLFMSIEQEVVLEVSSLLSDRPISRWIDCLILPPVCHIKMVSIGELQPFFLN